MPSNPCFSFPFALFAWVDETWQAAKKGCDSGGRTRISSGCFFWHAFERARTSLFVPTRVESKTFSLHKKKRFKQRKRKGQPLGRLPRLFPRRSAAGLLHLIQPELSALTRRCVTRRKSRRGALPPLACGVGVYGGCFFCFVVLRFQLPRPFALCDRLTLILPHLLSPGVFPGQSRQSDHSTALGGVGL